MRRQFQPPRLSPAAAIFNRPQQQIIDRYKGITGTPPDGQLPYGISFDAMIAAIVAHEDETGELRGEDW